MLLFGGFAQTMGQDQSKDGADVPGLCDCTTKQRRPPDDTDRLHALNTPRPAWQGHGARLSPEMVCRRDGGSLLHLSAARGDTFSVVAFVRGGHFAVNTRDNLGRTPLMLAAYFGCSSTVKLLYEIGANMDAEDCQGRTALMHSVEQEQWEVADWIKWQAWDAQKRKQGQGQGGGDGSPRKSSTIPSDRTPRRGVIGHAILAGRVETIPTSEPPPVEDGSWKDDPGIASMRMMTF